MWLPGSALEEPGIEEVARIVAQLGAGLPQTRIIARADSDFGREALMACEANGFECILDPAKNIIGEAARRSKEFVWSTQELEPSAACDRQGGVDARRSQSALRRHLADRDRPSLINLAMERGHRE
jgi:hypothetical protein